MTSTLDIMATAVFVTGPGVDSSVAVKVIVAVAPPFSVPIVQVTIVVPVQLPALEMAETQL